MVPPKIAQKPIGISSRDIGTDVRTAMRLTTGRNNAAAPTFDVYPDLVAMTLRIVGRALFDTGAHVVTL